MQIAYHIFLEKYLALLFLLSHDQAPLSVYKLAKGRNH